MLKVEVIDGTSRYLTLDRVLLIHPHSDEGLVIRFKNPMDEVQNLRVRRFQIIKSATWYD